MASTTSNVKFKNKTLGFTIVELLVVIVVIGILAAITIINYTGISAKASIATVQADLANASKKLSMYYAQYGEYPRINSITGCPEAPSAIDNNYCIKFSSGNKFVYEYKTATSYDLFATKGVVSYKVSNGGSPVDVSETLTPITAIGSITGTTQTGQTLAAGALTPSDATVSYQWQSATTAGGTYANIAGATSSTLTLNPSNINKYIKVVVTGTGSYTGNQISVASNQIVTDSNWKVIGSQVWATANLNAGTRIASATVQTNNSTIEKYCYGNTDANCTSYGGFYQWDEAMGYVNTERAQGICPVGTHIPSDNDFKILEISLGMSQGTAEASGMRGSDQGTQLKSGGSSGLNIPLTAYRETNGSFVNPLGGYLWSSTESSGSAWDRYFSSSQVGVGRNTNVKAIGFSVRCIGN